MAAKLNTRQADSVRAAIQSQRIVQELHRAYFGEREMTREQIRIAEILLNKTVPNLSAVDLSGDLETTVTLSWKS